MQFDELYKLLIPTEQSILEMVDEYTLYCYYTNQDNLLLNKSYNSPFRQDYFPSFSVFKTNQNIGVEFYWKDHATGESGNIFKLIQKIEGLSSKEEIFQKINEDFALGYNLPTLQERQKITLYNKPQDQHINIRIADVPLTEAGLKFWNQFDIKQDLLDLYHVNQIKWYWSYDSQETPTIVQDPTFSYRIGKYYQIYSPFASKEYKFRNNLPDNYFFGYLQLQKNEKLLVIDKSMKDVIFCRRLGINAIAPKSESTMIQQDKMLELKDRFQDIYLMLDPDEAGMRMTEKYIQKYNWLKPRFLPAGKDKTGLAKIVGIQEAERVIKQLIN